MPYLVFLAPALLAAAAIQGGQDEVTFPTIAGFIWEKLFFAMRATSLTGGQIADGVLLAAAVRVVFTTTLYWLVLFAFGAVEWTSALPLIAVSTFAGLCWAALMLAVSANVTNADAFFADRLAPDHHADVPVLRHVLPAVEPAAGPPVDRLDLAAVACHAAGPLAVLRHAAASRGRRWSASRTCSPWASSGIVLARRRFERRLTA